jgi:hypothetical protein
MKYENIGKLINQLQGSFSEQGLVIHVHPNGSLA